MLRLLLRAPLRRGVHHHSLTFDQVPDVLVYAPRRQEVIARHRVPLADAVQSVLGLPVLCGRPALLEEGHVAGGRQGDPLAPGPQARHHQPGRRIHLEEVNRLLTVPRRVLAEDPHRPPREGVKQLALNFLVIGVDHQLLSLGPLEEILDPLDRAAQLPLGGQLLQLADPDEMLGPLGPTRRLSRPRRHRGLSVLVAEVRDRGQERLLFDRLLSNPGDDIRLGPVILRPDYDNSTGTMLQVFSGSSVKTSALLRRM